ncbi:MAG: T9SS type A sorting domain-containing protein, partial [Saprospiraceae bacterium]|nr:T9SS type A sorting domain-containing protein [Saprospiraceae bacterium]
KTVNIRLSTDGGQTYPITLASGVVNDGKQFVTVPDAIGSNLRVRIDAADNVFYDISNQNFKIQAPAQPALSVGLSADNAEICMPANFSTEIYTAAVLGYSDPIQLQLVGSLPPGAVASFNTTNIQPGQSASLMVDLTNVNVEGIFTFDVQAVSGSQTYTRPITLTLRRNDFTGFALHTPANGLTNAGLTQTLRWTTGLDADLYDIQLSTSPDFNTLVASRTGTALDSFRVTVLLEKGKAYFWRVRPTNECGAHAWSDPYFFSTFAEDCRTFESNDLPKNLSANSTPTIETKITINQGGTISDINIKQIDGYHEFFKDLEAHLISPSGTDLLLWKDKCGNFNGNFNFGLDDSAPGAFQCPPNNTGTAYRPVNPLTVFNNQNSTGIWTFRVKDNVSGSGGALEAFKIELCASLAVTPPFLVINNIMPLPSGTSRVITPDFLLVEDTDNTHAELKYTVMTVPERGSISRAGVGVLQPGSQFTQANLDAGEITFQDFGVSGQPDGFYFMVTDGEGGFFGTPKFIAQPLVGTREPSKQTIEFLLFPNPAGKETQLAFSEPLDSDTRIAMTDMAGRILGEWLLGYGGNNLHLDLTGLPQGVYLIVVNNAEGRGIKKLVVR